LHLDYVIILGIYPVYSTLQVLAQQKLLKLNPVDLESHENKYESFISHDYFFYIKYIKTNNWQTYFYLCYFTR